MNSKGPKNSVRYIRCVDLGSDHSLAEMQIAANTQRFQMGERLLSSVTEQLLREVEKQYSKTGSLTDEILSSLQFVFQGILLPSLDLVDKEQVSFITSPSGRSLYQVVGSSGAPYICLPSSLYCSCPAYRFSVLLKEDHTMCKHMLAIELSRRMDRTRCLTVSNTEIADIIRNMVARDQCE